MLDDHIEIANLSRKVLTLRREILEIRERREIEKRQHFEWIQHLDQRMDIGSNRLRRYCIYPSSSSNELLLPVILRKQVIQATRGQELMNIYTRVMYKQNQQELDDMENFIHHEREELKERYATLDAVRDDLIQIVTKNVVSYHEVMKQQQSNNKKNRQNKYNNNKRRISLERLSRNVALDYDYDRASNSTTIQSNEQKEEEEKHYYDGDSWKKRTTDNYSPNNVNVRELHNKILQNNEEENKYDYYGLSRKMASWTNHFINNVM